MPFLQGLSLWLEGPRCRRGSHRPLPAPLGQQGTGLGVSMQHSTSPRLVHNGEMEQGFGAGPAASTADLAVAIHHDQLLRLHPALVHATGRHQQQQGLPLEHAAEIAPGAITPPPLMNGSHRLAEFLSELAFFVFARPRSVGTLGGLGAVGLASWPPTVFIPGEPGGGVAI